MRRTIEKIIEYAASIANAERIVLFGSMAQGRNNVFSDVDLLVISEDTVIRREATAKITSFCNELSLKVDVMIYTASEMEQARQNPRSFVAAIANSGNVVFDKRTCTSERM